MTRSVEPITNCPLFDDYDYPRWKVLMKKHLMSINSELWTVTEIGLTDLCKMENVEDIQKYTQLDDKARKIIGCSLTYVLYKGICHLVNAKLIWDRISDIYEGHHTSQDPMFVKLRGFLKSKKEECASSSSSKCLMEKGSKVLTHNSSSESSECEFDDNLKPN